MMMISFFLLILMMIFLAISPIIVVDSFLISYILISILNLILTLFQEFLTAMKMMVVLQNLLVDLVDLYFPLDSLAWQFHLEDDQD